MSEDQKELVRLVHMVWDQLEDMAATSAQATGVVQTLPISDAYLGIDDGLRFHLLMALDEQKEVINRRLTSGIEIITQSMEIDGTQAVMVDIVASKRWRHAIEPFSAEAISAMVDGTISLSILRNLVEEYRSLWAVPKEPLDPRRQRGIIAELKVLEELGSRVGYAQAVQKWTGSLSSKAGGLHDIGDEEFSIEVKSYHDEPPRVRINHIEQLDHRMDKRLTLVGVHIISNQEGMTLPDFIDESVDLYEAAGCRSIVEEKLTLAGWKEADREDYVSRFIVGRKVICPIRPETPVFPAHLKDRIPSSVSSISYLLHLNDLKSIPTDKDSSWKDMMFGEAWPTVSEGVSSDELMSNSCREIHDSPAESLAGMAESQNLEFKSSVWHAYQKPLNPNLSPQEVSKGIQEAVIKTICGFMNSEGGTLLVGVDDQNTVLGLEGDFKSKVIKDIDDYELRLIRLLSDNLGRPNVAEFVRLSFPLVNGNEICRIDVKPSTAPVFSKSEKFYVRVSNATNSLLPSETLTYCIGHWGY